MEIASAIFLAMVFGLTGVFVDGDKMRVNIRKSYFFLYTIFLSLGGVLLYKTLGGVFYTLSIIITVLSISSIRDPMDRLIPLFIVSFIIFLSPLVLNKLIGINIEFQQVIIPGSIFLIFSLMWEFFRRNIEDFNLS